jgi:SAM-dependent methyltransferase
MLGQNALLQEIRRLPPGAKVLDVGCLGFALYRACKEERDDLQHFGCDVIGDQAIPEDVTFKLVDLTREKIPFADDTFDLVVASHVIEHLPNAVPVFGELLRVCRPGGRVYVEAPSMRSTWVSSPIKQDWHLILSYYDDPTHTGRPWTPQAFYRLIRYYGCSVLEARYEFSLRHLLLLIPVVLWSMLRKDSDRIVEYWWKAIGWVCFCVAEKPAETTGAPKFNYFSFKGVPIGS